MPCIRITKAIWSYVKRQNSRYFRGPVWKSKSWLKKQSYMKTDAYKRYARVFWIFLPNVIKINHYDFELHHFKVAAFLRHSVGHSFYQLLANKGSISPYNIAGLTSNVSKKVATQIAQNYRCRQPHCHLTSPPRKTPRISACTLYFQKHWSHWPTFLSLIVWVYLHSFSRC